MISSVIAIVVLIILSAYFSATETAFTSLNRIRIKNLAADGNKRAELVLDLESNYDKLLTTILIGNNIVNITMTAVATVLFVKLLGTYGPTVATVVITVLVLVFGEITPKNVAKESAERFSMFSAPLIKVLVVLLTPINFIFTKWKVLISKLFKLDVRQSITQEEIMTIVEEAETEGTIDNERSELIQNAIEFDDLEAWDVLTPRPDIKAVDIEDSKDDVAELFRDTGFSRLPVYEDDMDKVMGVLNQKDFHNYVAGNKSRTISDFVKPVVFVPGSMKIAVLLKKMQRMKTHIAIVVDEYGGTEGLVTMEDIIEELVGEIYDEYDEELSQAIIPLQNGSYRVMCNANISKVFDYLGVHEDMAVMTVNGWVVMQLDRLPQKDDTFQCNIDDKILKVRVTKADDRKALEINLVVEELPEEEDEKRRHQ